MTFRPVLSGPIPTSKPKIIARAASDQQLWSFSFRYFQQIRNFGVGAKDSGWFVAMLEKLAELSKKTIASTNSNPSEKRTWRFHEVDWGTKSIPIQREHLNWIDRVYLDNNEEYPIQQFQITKALGRVIGFFDERRIFNIILLDPMHNMQPSEYSDYKVRATIVSETVSADVIRFIEGRLANCKEANCVCRVEYASFQQVTSNNDGGTTLLVHLPPELFLRVTKCVSSGTADSIADIIEASMGELES